MYISIWGKISLSAKPLINRISYGVIIETFTNFLDKPQWQTALRLAHELLRCCTNTSRNVGQHSTKSRPRHLILRSLKRTTPNSVTISVPPKSWGCFNSTRSSLTTYTARSETNWDQITPSHFLSRPSVPVRSQVLVYDNKIHLWCTNQH